MKTLFFLSAQACIQNPVKLDKAMLAARESMMQILGPMIDEFEAVTSPHEANKILNKLLNFAACEVDFPLKGKLFYCLSQYYQKDEQQAMSDLFLRRAACCGYISAKVALWARAPKKRSREVSQQLFLHVLKDFSLDYVAMTRAIADELSCRFMAVCSTFLRRMRDNAAGSHFFLFECDSRMLQLLEKFIEFDGIMEKFSHFNDQLILIDNSAHRISDYESLREKVESELRAEEQLLMEKGNIIQGLLDEMITSAYTYRELCDINELRATATSATSVTRALR